jgi:hypothetical protein
VEDIWEPWYLPVVETESVTFFFEKLKQEGVLCSYATDGVMGTEYMCLDLEAEKRTKAVV